MASHVGINALLYTTDGASKRFYTAGSVEGALTTIDFGTGLQASTIYPNNSTKSDITFTDILVFRH